MAGVGCLHHDVSDHPWDNSAQGREGDEERPRVPSLAYHPPPCLALLPQQRHRRLSLSLSLYLDLIKNDILPFTPFSRLKPSAASLIIVDLKSKITRWIIWALVCSGPNLFSEIALLHMQVGLTRSILRREIIKAQLII